MVVIVVAMIRTRRDIMHKLCKGKTIFRQHIDTFIHSRKDLSLCLSCSAYLGTVVYLNIYLSTYFYLFLLMHRRTEQISPKSLQNY